MTANEWGIGLVKKFAVAKSKAHSCRPMYDGVSPHRRERESAWHITYRVSVPTSYGTLPFFAMVVDSSLLLVGWDTQYNPVGQVDVQ